MKEYYMKKHVYSVEIRNREREGYFKQIRDRMLHDHQRESILNEADIISMLLSSQNKENINYHSIFNNLVQLRTFSQSFSNHFAQIILNQHRNQAQPLYCLSHLINQTDYIQYLTQETNIRKYLKLLIEQNMENGMNMDYVFGLIGFWYEKVERKEGFRGMVGYYEGLMRRYGLMLSWLTLFNQLIQNKQLMAGQNSIIVMLQNVRIETVGNEHLLQINHILFKVTANYLSIQSINIIYQYISHLIHTNNHHITLHQQNVSRILNLLTNLLTYSHQNVPTNVINPAICQWILGLVKDDRIVIRVSSVNYLCVLINVLEGESYDWMNGGQQLIKVILQLIEMDVVSIKMHSNILCALALIFAMDRSYLLLFSCLGGQKYLQNCYSSKNKRISEFAAFILQQYCDQI